VINLEMKDIKKHPCMTKDGILKGFVCPFCAKIYAYKEQAISCKESHDDFQVDYFFEKGHRFPVEVIIKRIKGNEIIEIGKIGRAHV